MEQPHQAKPIHGPHHCATASSRAVRFMFDTLLDEARKRGGKLSYDDLLAYRQKFTHGNQAIHNDAVNTFNTCMGVLPGPKQRRFDRAQLLPLLLRVRMADRVGRVFSRQINIGDKQWTAAFATAFAQGIREAIGSNVDEVLFRAYMEVSERVGLHLSIRDIIDSDSFDTIYADILSNIDQYNSQSGHLLKILSDHVNRQLRSTFPTKTQKYLVKAGQIDALLSLLRQDQTRATP